jgi:hypothetical protein
MLSNVLCWCFLKPRLYDIFFEYAYGYQNYNDYFQLINHVYKNLNELKDGNELLLIQDYSDSIGILGLCDLSRAFRLQCELYSFFFGNIS